MTKITAAQLKSIVLRRQGGSSTIWSTPGTTSYDVTSDDVKIQCGTIAVDNSAKTVTFPIPFTYKPHVQLTVASALGANVYVRYKDASSSNTQIVDITTLSDSGSVQTSEIVNWMAIGV